MFKTCYLARYFHFLLTFFIHYFSSVSLCNFFFGGGGGGGRGWRFGPLCCQPPLLIIPSSSPSFTGSRIFDFYQILYFYFFKVRIFLVKRSHVYSAISDNELLLLLLLTGVLLLVLFRNPAFRTPTFRFPLP